MYLEAEDGLSNTRTNSLPCNAGNERYTVMRTKKKLVTGGT